MNQDRRNNPPSPQQISNQSWTRFGYDVSWETGSEDFDRAYSFYASAIAELRVLKKEVILVLTHETWGEGRMHNYTPIGYDFVDRWVQKLADGVVRKYAGMGLWYQIWNEPDTASAAAIGIPRNVYLYMLRQAYQVFKDIDPSCKIMLGGIVGGPGQITNYLIGDWYNYVDASASHEYGSDTPSARHPVNPTGYLQGKINAWKQANRGKLHVITEWGVLSGNPDAIPYAEVVQYAREFNKVCIANGVPQLWFAWYYQHDAYPMVRRDGTVRHELLSVIGSKLGTQPPPTIPTNPDVVGLRYRTPTRIRTGPGVGYTTIGVGYVAQDVRVSKKDLDYADGYFWVKVQTDIGEGWSALIGVTNFSP